MPDYRNFWKPPLGTTVELVYNQTYRDRPGSRNVVFAGEFFHIENQGPYEIIKIAGHFRCFDGLRTSKALDRQLNTARMSRLTLGAETIADVTAWAVDLAPFPRYLPPAYDVSDILSHTPSVIPEARLVIDAGRDPHTPRRLITASITALSLNRYHGLTLHGRGTFPPDDYSPGRTNRKMNIRADNFIEMTDLNTGEIITDFAGWARQIVSGDARSG